MNREPNRKERERGIQRGRETLPRTAKTVNSKRLAPFASTARNRPIGVWRMWPANYTVPSPATTQPRIDSHRSRQFAPHEARHLFAQLDWRRGDVYADAARPARALRRRGKTRWHFAAVRGRRAGRDKLARRT